MKARGIAVLALCFSISAQIGHATTRTETIKNLIKEASARKLQLMALAMPALTEDEKDQLPYVTKTKIAIGPILPKELDDSSLGAIQAGTGLLMGVAAAGLYWSAQAQCKELGEKLTYSQIPRWVYFKYGVATLSAVGGGILLLQWSRSSGNKLSREERRPWFRHLQTELEFVAWTTHHEYFEEVTRAATIATGLESHPARSAAVQAQLKEDFNEYLKNEYEEGGVFDLLERMGAVTDAMDEFLVPPEKIESLRDVEEAWKKTRTELAEEKKIDVTPIQLLRGYTVAIKEITKALNFAMSDPAEKDSIDRAAARAAIHKATVFIAKVELLTEGKK